MTTPNSTHDDSNRFPAVSWASGETYGLETPHDYDTDDPTRVWCTLTEGAITEPRFPRVDVMNLRTLSFIVTDGDGYVARTSRPTQRTTDSLERTVMPTADDALVYEHQFRETAAGHDWALTVETAVDTESEALCCSLAFDAADALTEYDVYVVGQPTPSARGVHIRAERVGETGDHGLVAYDTEGGSTVIHDQDGEPYRVALALEAADGFDWAAVREGGENGTEPLEGDDGAAASGEGIVSLGARVGTDVSALETEVALGFATDADVDAARAETRRTLERGSETIREDYVASWRSYLADLDVPASVVDDPDRRVQYDFAAMTLKAVEDKTFVGAGLASPSVPWGTGVEATEAADYGYNFVWSRDLYQVSTAFEAMGDVESAIDATAYLFRYQLEDDGFLPQNTYLEGTTRWGGEQLDNISFPIVMAYQLANRHDHGLDQASYDYEDVRTIAEYILRSGPDSEQERWEEEAGYSPSTIAAEIAGLVCAAWFADRVGADEDAIRYLAVADDWSRGVEEWCATTTGTDEHATPYYVRVSVDGRPDEPSERTLANGGPTLDERDIVDAGFLELVRLGILSWDDEVVRNSLAVVDETIRVDTPHGPAWYRYNGDGYGEQTADGPDGAGAPWSLTHAGKGRLWPIFTGERGEYELLADETDADLEPAALLETMTSFANSGRMLPEQVWDSEDPTDFGWTFGSGTAAATPLAWSCAQYVRLAHSIDAGYPIETPEIVADFFRERGRGRTSSESTTPTLELEADNETVSGTTDGDYVVAQTDAGVETRAVTDGRFSLERGDAASPIRVVAVSGGEDVWDLDTATVVLQPNRDAP
ncbi:glycoside hydrolase family 15 protein [Natronosalvus caseinilyticus]|uniref:glycoside hydrolase family 15 protein n=1 Tax=Natronosalvus caseinilyticus TaxID=2953747 RepID=UPI0028B15315|nr:glycoside hydrolase family 15 protein [Natronosalvus caseinilyticus]